MFSEERERGHVREEREGEKERKNERVKPYRNDFPPFLIHYLAVSPNLNTSHWARGNQNNDQVGLGGGCCLKCFLINGCATLYFTGQLFFGG